MTISLASLAPNLVKAAVEGRLPRGISIERLRDPPTEWSRQFEALGLNRNSCSAAKDLELQQRKRPIYGGLCSRTSRSRLAAGNGIFGCGDRAPKIATEMRKRPQRPKSGM
jgi:hypothetical protein